MSAAYIVLAIVAPGGIGYGVLRILRGINRLHIQINSRVDILINRNQQLAETLIANGIPIPAPRLVSDDVTVKSTVIEQ